MVRAVPLGLHIYAVKAQRVLTDNSVESLVASTAEMLGSPCPSAVAHCGEEAQDQLLEEHGVAFADALEQFCSNGSIGFFDGVCELLARRDLVDQLAGCRRPVG